MKRTKQRKKQLLALTYQLDYGQRVNVSVPWPLTTSSNLAGKAWTPRTERFFWPLPGRERASLSRDVLWGVLFIGDQIRGAVGYDVDTAQEVVGTNMVIPDVNDFESIQRTFSRVVQAVLEERKRSERERDKRRSR
jgi:hypothetical protein